MATWQAHFEIVGEGSYPADYLTRLDEVGPRYVSWSTDLLAWGDENGNRVTVLLEKGMPVESSVRIDMREPDLDFIRQVLDFVRYAGFSLQDESGRRIEPVEGEFWLALRGSRAFRFVQDPELYLRRLQLGRVSEA